MVRIWLPSKANKCAKVRASSLHLSADSGEKKASRGSRSLARIITQPLSIRTLLFAVQVFEKGRRFMVTDNDQYTVLVPSTDGYSDLWKPFLYYLDKSWNWRTSTLLLGSNLIRKDLPAATVCAVGTSNYWGEHFLKLLDLVETDTVLVVMPDFFLTQKVERQKFDYYLELFQKTQLKCLALVPRSIHSRSQEVYPGCKSINLSGAYSLALEISLWRVTALREALRPNDSPWSFERSTRIAGEDPRNWCFANEAVFHYIPTGALIRGSWTRNSLRMLTSDGLQNCIGDRPILSRRRSFVYSLRTLSFRIIALVYPALVRKYNLHVNRVSGHATNQKDLG